MRWRKHSRRSYCNPLTTWRARETASPTRRYTVWKQTAGTAPASTRRSASPCTPPVFLAPSQKDWLQLRAAYKHREGSWQKSLSTLRTTSAVSRANRASSKSAAVRPRAATPLIPRQRPPVPGARAATNSSPSAAPIWTRAAGTSATLSTSAVMPTWTTQLGMAIISRVLDAHGYKVGIICQPDWTDPASITVLGEPRLGFLVSAGNMDSMVNHYSVTKHRRHTDAYTPVARRGTVPIAPSQSTATLSVRRSRTPPSSSAVSRQACAAWPTTTTGRTSSSARCCSTRAPTSSSTAWASTRLSRSPTHSTRGCRRSDHLYQRHRLPHGSLDEVYDYDLLPSWDDLAADKLNYARSFNVQQQNMDPITGHRLVEPYPNSVYVVQNPPSGNTHHRRDGRGCRTLLRTRLASRLRRGGRRAGLCRDQVFH